MGTTHYLAWKQLARQMDLEVVAIADCRKELLDKAAKHFPNAKTYEFGMDLIKNEELDIADICLPSYMHADHAIAAMEKGMNVFSEKPVCLSKEDGKRLLETEKRTGVKAMVGQVIRSWPEYLYLKKVYEEKKLGKLKSIVMQRTSNNVLWGFDNWFQDEERSGSVVLDLHVHDLDFLRYMLGEPDRFDVRATAFESGMINQIITTYEFGNVFVTTEGMWDVSTAVPFEASFHACFEEGSVFYNGNKEETLTVYKKDGTKEVPDLSAEFNEKSNEAGINISDLGPYHAELKYFAECLRDNKPIEIAPLCEGVSSVDLALDEWKATKEYIAKHQ